MDVQNIELNDEIQQHPLEKIEDIIYQLMKQSGKLKFEINEQKIKQESDMKAMLLSFIEVTDFFENILMKMGLKVKSEDKKLKIWHTQYKMVYKTLMRTLKSWDVIQIETIIGDKPNLEWHKVTEVMEDISKPNETIIEELKKGYLWRGKLLRPAEIKAIRNRNR